MIPKWTKDPKTAYKTIIARLETVDTAPSYRQDPKMAMLLKVIEITVNCFDLLWKFLKDTFSMLNWDFIKNDPVTYRAIKGATRFEVTVQRDDRKGTITVTRTEGDKFAIKVFRDHRKALRWCEKHPWRHESFFGLFRL